MQVLNLLYFRAQLLELQQLAYFWLLAVIWGCLAVFGTGFSTSSAQDGHSIVHLAPFDLSQRQIISGRRRRRAGRAELTQAELIAATYSRFSSDKQSETSITDQRRKCHEAADRNGHRIRPEFEYADEAVSGTKLRRDGLDALLRDAEAGEFHVLYFHSLSRLARESVITMPLLKQLVHVFGVRIISVTEGIDSSRDGWEVIATIMALLHEKYIKELSENVFRGQEGTVIAGLCSDCSSGCQNCDVAVCGGCMGQCAECGDCFCLSCLQSTTPSQLICASCPKAKEEQ